MNFKITLAGQVVWSHPDGILTHKVYKCIEAHLIAKRDPSRLEMLNEGLRPLETFDYTLWQLEQEAGKIQ